jgi:hypothetical protein
MQYTSANWWKLSLKTSAETGQDGSEIHGNNVTYNKYVIKVKVKVTPEQATKPQRGSRGITLLFL